MLQHGDVSVSFVIKNEQIPHVRYFGFILAPSFIGNL
jgi:hypothetical protein